MLAHQVVLRVMCLVAGRMKKLLQKVTFVKSNKILFQLLRLICCHEYMNLLNFSLTGGHVCLMKSLYLYIYSSNIFESLPQELDHSLMRIDDIFLPHCDYVPISFPTPGGRGGLHTLAAVVYNKIQCVCCDLFLQEPKRKLLGLAESQPLKCCQKSTKRRQNWKKKSWQWERWNWIFRNKSTKMKLKKGSYCSPCFESNWKNKSFCV